MSEEQFLTAEGLERLRQELAYLTGTARIQLAKRLRAAVQQGDLSENADYIAAKEEQAFLEGRIQELEYIINNAVIFDDKQELREIVELGAHVTVQIEDYPPETYVLVGPKESDPYNGRISNESPIGRAIIGHRAGDEVYAETPVGRVQLKILDIQ